MSRAHLAVVAALLTAGLFVGVQAATAPAPETTTTQQMGEQTMPYTVKDFSKLIGMKGFSDQMLKNHFTLYKGYVDNTNKLLETLQGMEPDAKDPKYAELRRRLGFEFDGIKLHEYYFENLGGKGGEPKKESDLAARMEQDFGGVEQWKKDFVATGSMRGVGWAVLYEDPANGRLINFWINEHHVNHPAGCVPILIMDVWEHAFMLDYQLDRKAYIDAFMANVDWAVVEKRYQAAR